MPSNPEGAALRRFVLSDDGKPIVTLAEAVLRPTAAW